MTYPVPPKAPSMLGLRIKELRNRWALSKRKLARKSGLTYALLSNIENGEENNISHEHLLKIADCLPISAEEYIYLFRLTRSKRHFQAYNIGLVKTGTCSISSICSNYRTLHEYAGSKLPAPLSVILPQYLRGDMPKEEVRKMLRKRDNEHLLEMDSSFFNYAYLDILTEEFPHAKFIFTIRDVYSWLDSFLNWHISMHHHLPERTFRLLSSLVGIDLTPLKIDAQVCRRTFARPSTKLIRVIGALIEYWVSSNERIVQQLPAGRSMTVRTDRISNSVDEITDFLGIPRKILDRKKTHRNKAKRKYNLLHQMGRAFPIDQFNGRTYALMNRFFPDRTLKAFLARQDAGMKQAAGAV